MSNFDTINTERKFSLPKLTEATKKDISVPYADYEKAFANNEEFKISYPQKEEFLKRTAQKEKYLETGLAQIDANNKIYMYNIPTEYQTFVVFNEAYCKNVAEEKGYCAKMVEEELKLVNEKILEDFLVWRLNFFKGIYEYYTDPDVANCLAEKGVADGLVENKEQYLDAIINFNKNYADEMKLCVEVIEKFMSKRNISKNVCENFSNQTSEILQK